jgi:hypothetical protein
MAETHGTTAGGRELRNKIKYGKKKYRINGLTIYYHLCVNHVFRKR